MHWFSMHRVALLLLRSLYGRRCFCYAPYARVFAVHPGHFPLFFTLVILVWFGRHQDECIRADECQCYYKDVTIDPGMTVVIDCQRWYILYLCCYMLLLDVGTQSDCDMFHNSQR